MSHYAVIVVINERIAPEHILERIDRDMAPFMENCCAEPEKRFMKFYDTEDEMIKEYEEGSREMIVMPDGRLLLPWDDEFRRKPKEGEDPIKAFVQPEAPAELPRRQVPFKETFSTFEEYAKEWHGRAERDETMNRFGYWQNPQAKWDWYEVGGRWAGFFQLKPGRHGGKGSQYNFSGAMEPSTDKADICLRNAIDLEAMRQECEDEAIKRYDAVWESIKNTPEALSWEMVKSGYDLHKPGDIDKARDEYHAQSRVEAFKDLLSSEKGRDMFGWMANVEDYQIPREEYIQKARNGAAVPFAILKDGKWYESGEMGWFGCASNEKDPETWNSMVAKLMDELPGETILAVCDCHI